MRLLPLPPVHGDEDVLLPTDKACRAEGILHRVVAVNSKLKKSRRVIVINLVEHLLDPATVNSYPNHHLRDLLLTSSSSSSQHSSTETAAVNKVLAFFDFMDTSRGPASS